MTWWGTGIIGRVEIESEWTRRRRERAAGETLSAQSNCPTQANPRLEWATRRPAAAAAAAAAEEYGWVVVFSF